LKSLLAKVNFGPCSHGRSSRKKASRYVGWKWILYALPTENLALHMTSSFEDRTSSTLLARVHAGDPGAWADLVRRYTPLIYQWCRAWRLQEADAQDLTQEVLIKLTRRMRQFHYDPARSFRAYLKTLARYAWCDLLADGRRPGAGGGDRSRVQQMLRAAVESGEGR
jgi:hypothetical protein